MPSLTHYNHLWVMSKCVMGRKNNTQDRTSSPCSECCEGGEGVRVWWRWWRGIKPHLSPSLSLSPAAVQIRNYKWYHDNFTRSSNQWCFTDSFAMIPCYGSSCESGTCHGARSPPPAEPGQWPGRQQGMPVPAACAALTKQQGTVKNPLIQTLQITPFLTDE